MTEPSEPAAADRDLEPGAEVIEDPNVTGAGAGDIPAAGIVRGRSGPIHVPSWLAPAETEALPNSTEDENA